MAKLPRGRCEICGSVSHPVDLCPLPAQDKNAETFSERLAQEAERLKKQNKHRPRVLPREDGLTWMVSVIHPDHKNGSVFFSERAGKTALEAAMSYFSDREDSKGADLAHRDPEMTLIAVVDSQNLAPSRKAWKVNLFMPKQKTDGTFELIEFS